MTQPTKMPAYFLTVCWRLLGVMKAAPACINRSEFDLHGLAQLPDALAVVSGREGCGEALVLGVEVGIRYQCGPQRRANISVTDGNSGIYLGFQGFKGVGQRLFGDGRQAHGGAP